MMLTEGFGPVTISQPNLTHWIITSMKEMGRIMHATLSLLEERQDIKVINNEVT